MPNQRISNVLTRPPLPEIDLLDLWKSISREVMFNLTADIPPPKAKVPKAQKTFATLKPGDVLLAKELNIFFRITSVDSLGAYAGDNPVVFGKDWKENYSKMKKKDLKKITDLASIDSVTVR